MNSTDERKTLFAALHRGPAVLFVGQKALAVEGTDHFFRELRERFKRPNATDYLSIFDSVEPNLRPSMEPAMREASRVTIPPEWLQVVGEVPWNSAITSAFHDVLERAFRTEARRVAPLLSDEYWPPDPLNRQELHVLKLFGCVTGDRPIERPPTNLLSLEARVATATNMLRNLASLVTPRGVLIIEGYDPSDDWLELGHLTPQLAQLATGQTHWFSCATPPTDRRVKALIEQGRLVLHREPFIEWVRAAKEEGLLTPQDDTSDWASGITLTGLDGKRLIFTPAEWRKLTQGLPVLDDAVTADPPPFDSADDRYHTFRQFLYESGLHPPRWTNHVRGFVFRREEANALHELVFRCLAEPTLKPDPVLLCGQSGSGKTVALADLAFEARMRRWPVIHLTARWKRLNYQLVSEVCENLERMHAPSLLLVWDGLTETGGYQGLARFLSGRGRKVLVVGSMYRKDAKEKGEEKDEQDEMVVVFPAVLTPEDGSRFTGYLAGIDPRLARNDLPVIDRNFFALLYRWLPPTRAKLERGVRREWDVILRRLQQPDAAESPGDPDKVWEALESSDDDWQPMWKCPLVTGEPGQTVKGEAARAHMARLTLVPGRYKVGVPVDLAVRAARAVGVDGFEVIRSENFMDLGVFSWEEDAQGNPVLRVRTSLEAGIICDADFVVGDGETTILRQLVTNVRLGSLSQPNPETEFLTDLFNQIEPDGEFGHRFRNRLSDLIGMLAALRQRYNNKVHPQLVVREANLRRRWLHVLTDRLQATGTVPSGQKPLEIFHQGLELIVEAEAAADRPEYGNRFARDRSQLLTELASLYGSAQKYYGALLKQGQAAGDQHEWEAALVASYQEAIDACRRALVIDPYNAHPSDVRFWVARDRYEIQHDQLTDEQKAELIAEMCDSLEEETWALQPEQFRKRQHNLGKLRKDEAQQEEAIKALHKQGSMTGYYLIACDSVYDEKHQFRDKETLKKALDYLGGVPNSLDDPRVLRLYLTVWWRVHGDPNLFDKDRERTGLKLSPKQWTKFAALLQKRLSQPAEQGNVRWRFLLAWALFQCEKYEDALTVFQELERMPRGGIDWSIRRAVWCDDQGRPVPCDGTIRQFFQGDDRGYVHCRQIGRRIPFQVEWFKAQDLRINGPLKDFYIAFNFRGPIADSVRAYS